MRKTRVRYTVGTDWAYFHHQRIISIGSVKHVSDVFPFLEHEHLHDVLERKVGKKASTKLDKVAVPITFLTSFSEKKQLQMLRKALK